MSDEPSGRQEPTPTGSEVARLEEAVTPVPEAGTLEVERFSAGPRAHMVGLTEERAAQIVRQSGSARNAAFLAVLVIALFIPVYWFYDIGIPAIGAQGRLEKEAQVQYVTDVSRGYSLYLANCARCHGDNGQGGQGPPLNDQAKLYNAVRPDGRSGTGHLNPTYLDRVLSVGGRYVCGDPQSGMPAWKQPAGPLNYRAVEEIIAWLTASNEVVFEYDPAAHGTAVGTHAEPVTVRGWRDPNWQPAPGATPPPACWRNPSGQIGGAAPAASPAAPAAIENPGTPEAPRVVRLDLTGDLRIVDDSGAPVAQIAVKAGETVTFEVDNTAGFAHNFYIGTAEQLQVPDGTTEVGIPTFESGVQTLTWTVPAEGAFQYACTVPGHYTTMHGDFVIVQ